MESTSSTAMGGGQEHHRRSAPAGISSQIPSICIKEDCVEGAWVSGVGCWSYYKIYKLAEFNMVGR
jgi:hypothetical protein